VSDLSGQRPPGPLNGWLVVDLSTGIAGGYCTKMLADGGADVIKVEPPGGDPLRRWSASGHVLADGEDGALFQYLSAAKRHVVADGDAVDELLSGAHVVVWSPGSQLTPAELRTGHPHLVVTSITPFGLEEPWSERPATEFTLQAWSGGIIGLGRGDPDRAPAFVGGQVGEWLAGAYAAVGTMISRWRASGAGELVDVSMLEALVMCLTYFPVTYFDGTGRSFRGKRSVVTPGVGMAKDGMVAVGVGTGQHWLDFAVMVGHPEWTEDRSLFRERSHLAPVINEWFATHTVDEIREMAAAFRLPHALIGNGANLPELDHFEARNTFVRSAGHGVVQPGPPYRLAPAARSGQGPPARAGAGTSSGLPFRGLRVLDMTAFWAGPSCTHALALLGAEVIHLESTGRVDGTRTLGAAPSEVQWWEKSPIFSALNTNKKSLTIDIQSAAGRQLLDRLIATTDVIVENYTPRVLDQAGLSFDALRALRDDIILLRMPGFGLDGPWRDNAAFAYTIEDASGLTWLTGFPDQNPLEPYCIGDPNAGLHALAGLLLALEHRRRTGEGVAVEAAMVDAAVQITAEQVIEYSAYGALLERAGNRGPGAVPQNVYPTSGGRDSWVAIAVATDEQWSALVEVVGRPEWSGRREAIDDELGEWCSQRSADEIVDLLWPAGVPVAKVMQPHDQGDLAQLQARGFFEVVDHPVLGPARHSTVPFRFSNGPHQFHVRPAPLLGEHNAELLGGLGLTAEELARLESEGVIGRTPVG
jgi:crotonobetainyl-CoA:carnitine CoA-transferase CaiB-like acyl-CoA transferase